MWLQVLGTGGSDDWTVDGIGIRKHNIAKLKNKNNERSKKVGSSPVSLSPFLSTINFRPCCAYLLETTLDLLIDAF